MYRVSYLIILVVLTSICLSFTLKDSVEEIIESLNSRYLAESYQFNYSVVVKQGDQPIQNLSGVVAKRNDSFYKKMGDLEIISDGSYVVSIDKRIMKIYYYNSSEVQYEKENLSPKIDVSGIELISSGASEYLLKSEIVSLESDSASYYIGVGTYNLNRVVNYKTQEDITYTTEIVYNNERFDSKPSDEFFQLSLFVNGKGKAAKLKSNSKTKGYTFINTLN